jgi:hypothetical protein
MDHRRTICLALAALLWNAAVAARATEMYEQSPVNYSASQPNDAIARLQARLTDGTVKLGGRERELISGLLRELRVPTESQVVVFSKTSLQRQRISPDRPRAIYFSDDCYIGWVPGGLVEVIAIDPRLGPVFYQLDPGAARAGAKPSFVRDNDCLRCHGGTFVRDIPGLFVRSLHTDADGEMLLRGGSAVVDFRTPFTNRWGGWYVTGKHGSALHRGNVFTEEKNNELVADFKRGANVTSLDQYFDTSRYLTNSSDIVALLVLEHQTAMQNTITRAGMNCRRMLEYQEALLRELKETSTNELAYDSVRSVFNGAVRDLVDDLLFYQEAVLPAGLEGWLAYQQAFQANARRNAAGQSLKDFSLHGQLFRNRCSYLIYSDSFLALPLQLKRRVYARLKEILEAENPESRYAYLGKDERVRITTILLETHPEFQTFAAGPPVRRSK